MINHLLIGLHFLRRHGWFFVRPSGMVTFSPGVQHVCGGVQEVDRCHDVPWCPVMSHDVPWCPMGIHGLVFVGLLRNARWVRGLSIPIASAARAQGRVVLCFMVKSGNPTILMLIVSICVNRCSWCSLDMAFFTEKINKKSEVEIEHDWIPRRFAVNLHRMFGTFPHFSICFPIIQLESTWDLLLTVTDRHWPINPCDTLVTSCRIYLDHEAHRPFSGLRDLFDQQIGTDAAVEASSGAAVR